MKNIKWSVREGSRHVDSGSVLAKDEREVLRRILARDLGDFSPVPEKCYRVSAGDALASAYGDEFERTCHAVGDPEGLPGEATIEEHALTGGFLFDDPPRTVTGSGWDDPDSNPLGDFKHQVMAMSPCPGGSVHDMNGDTIRDGKVFPTCRKCGLVSDEPCRRATLDEVARSLPGQNIVDPDRLREERAVEESVLDLVRAGTISVEEGARLIEGARAGATLPLIDPTKRLGVLGCSGPSDHRLMSRRLPHVSATGYECSRCGRAYAVSDQQMVSARGGPDFIERMVREALSR